MPLSLTLTLTLTLTPTPPSRSCYRPSLEPRSINGRGRTGRLDLHHLSVGASEAAVRWWLQTSVRDEFRHERALGASSGCPIKALRIVTGHGPPATFTSHTYHARCLDSRRLLRSSFFTYVFALIPLLCQANRVRRTRCQTCAHTLTSC